MKKLIVASGNKGKLKEIKEILDGKYEIISMTEAGFSGDIEENGNSFYENALIKAKTVSEALGEDALADDSGLCVEALGGAPGIFSARYSGVGATAETNNQKLLNALDGILDRKAKFCCSVVLYKATAASVMTRFFTAMICKNRSVCAATKRKTASVIGFVRLRICLKNYYNFTRFVRFA